MTQDLSKLTVDELFKLGGVEVYDDLHFVYTSEDHGSGYANLRPLAHPENLPVLRELGFRLICTALVQGDFPGNERIAIIGPETLGAVIAKEAVEEYNRRDPHREPLLYGSFIHDPADDKKFLWGEGGGMALMQPDPKRTITSVIWVDDLLNKASTWQRTKHLVDDLWPGAIKMLATIADRSKETARSIGVPMVSLRKLIIDSYTPDTCPLCKDEIPIVVKPGHGHTYKQMHPDYPGGFREL